MDDARVTRGDLAKTKKLPERTTRSAAPPRSIEESDADKDISSEEDSDVFVGDDSFSYSSESSGEEEDGSIGDHKTKKVDEFSDFSEDDEEDEDDVRESRRAMKKKQLEDVEAAMQGGAGTDSSLYQPDKRSRQFAKQFFIHPLLTENNKDYRKLSPTEQEKMQDMVERGLIKDTVSQAFRLGSTVPIYYKAAKQVLGRMQENELKNDYLIICSFHFLDTNIFG